MPIAELAVLLPCHSLEDFPLYYEGDEAASLLSAWIAPWHPALIAATGRTPRWYRADFPPDELAGRVFVVPSVSQRLIAAGWTARAEEEGALVVIARPDRQQTIGKLLERSAVTAQQAAANLAGDFLALGYAYLQMELLTRHMRYMSSLDEPYFEGQLVAAARAAVESNESVAKEHLKHCFDVLMEARDRFYPVDAYLLDMVLTADAVLANLPVAAASATPLSIHLAGKTLDTLAEANPQVLSELRGAIAAGNVSIAGGEYEESELPLLSIPRIAENFERGRNCYLRHLGTAPRVYMRRRFGLSPMLPMLLSRAGFIGCVHCTFDDGVFPTLGQSKSRWQGLDGSVIDAFFRIPFDASKAETFLSLSQKLAESMDMDQVATVALAHWPGQVCEGLEDLKRIHAYAPLFGKFVTLDDYFQNTESSGRLDKLEADDYRSPYLRQAVAGRQADPISGYVRRTTSELRQRVAGSMGAISDIVRGRQEVANHDRGTDGCDLDVVAAKLVRLIAPQSESASRGILAFNPFAHSVRPGQFGAEKVLPSNSPVEVPALGFAWIPEEVADVQRGGKAAQPIAVENRLANEHLEVTIDPTTGGIRSIRDLRHRGNRLSQQLALRTAAQRSSVEAAWNEEGGANYSIMAADSVEIVFAGPAAGAIASQGKLLDRDGNRLAGFRQQVYLARGARVLVIDMHIDPTMELPVDPWNAYYACRFAWADDSAELYRSVHQASQRTRLKRIEAPHFVEIREERTRTAILTGGLPFHRRNGERMLDSLLIVAGETARDFRLGIGIDLPALSGASEELILGDLPNAPAFEPAQNGGSGWLFHIDAPSVITLDWEGILSDGKCCGFRVRLLETNGRAGRVKLRTFKPVAEAVQVDSLGNTVVNLTVTADAVLVSFCAYEQVDVEARFAP